jgi:3-oxoacyl-[acyl-carrier protein] reductase
MYMEIEMDRESRVALITGSSRSIGRAIALRLASEGFRVVVHGKANESACQEVTTQIRKMGMDAFFVLADLGRRDDVQRLAKKAHDTFGRVDVLVNNAAIRPHSDFLDMDEAEWHNVLTTNLQSAFWLLRACMPEMAKRGWGRVINFAGMQAIRGYVGAAHVSVSKHALWGLTKALAKELGPKGITFNIISPGPTGSGDQDHHTETRIKHWGKKIPIGRIGEPDDIAAIVSLLVSNSGALVNGQMIQANGGLET